ncbi:hypothetical protein SUGI_0722870 [Cryptomeria japonica]|nr:hypothetical protein SUGI_0722870 [Cryptomeria japonica]
MEETLCRTKSLQISLFLDANMSIELEQSKGVKAIRFQIQGTNQWKVIYLPLSLTGKSLAAAIKEAVLHTDHEFKI